MESALADGRGSIPLSPELLKFLVIYKPKTVRDIRHSRVIYTLCVIYVFKVDHLTEG